MPSPGKKASAKKSAPPNPHDIAGVLEREILAGKLAPGGRFATEYELCARFGVSRTPVREALRRLQSAGLVVSRHGSGTYVADRSVEDVASAVRRYGATARDTTSWVEMMEVRQILEIGAVWRATRRAAADPKAALPLIAALNTMEKASGNLAAFLAADAAFHRTLVATAGNAAICAMHEALMPALREYMRRSFTRKDLIAGSQEEHRAIVRAVAKGDAEEAAAAVSDHLARSVVLALSSRAGTSPVA